MSMRMGYDRKPMHIEVKIIPCAYGVSSKEFKKEYREAEETDGG